MWQHSCMNLEKGIQSLTKEEEAIVKNILKNRTPVGHVGNAEAGTLRGSRYASSSRHNAGPSTGFTLFGVNLFDPERHPATEATLNSNKRKRDSTELGLPPTFVGMPTFPVEVPRRVSNYNMPLGLSANRTSRLFRSSQGEPSTAVTTSQHCYASKDCLQAALAVKSRLPNRDSVGEFRSAGLHIHGGSKWKSRYLLKWSARTVPNSKNLIETRMREEWRAVGIMS
ncbi:hypothetical protein L6452_44439 [Arctium lappa]|uniref:Uncharacterized protein n=1 Tax=Arctium lappa TaxID=4217 RepID=A0ACB8XGX2_ARCLA|nr:hypothetical protein L6452_44439 [Arctium lappa]